MLDGIVRLHALTMPSPASFAVLPTSCCTTCAPLSPLRMAFRTSLPTSLCRSVYRPVSALHPLRMCRVPSGSPQSGQRPSPCFLVVD